MGFLRRLFGGGDSDMDDGAGDAPAQDDRQAVTAWVRLGDRAFENEREQLQVFELENRLIRAVDQSGLGSYDTNDLANGFMGLRVAGPDADALLPLVRDVVAKVPAGSYLTIRRGPTGTSEERLEFD